MDKPPSPLGRDPETCRVLFEPSGREVVVRAGQTVLEAARLARLPLTSVCGGVGTCGKCRVRAPAIAPNPLDDIHLSEEEVRRGYRLGCQIKVLNSLVLELPPRPRETGLKVLRQGLGRPVLVDPAVRQAHLEVPRPDPYSDLADWERVKSCLPPAWGPVEISLPLLRQLPGLLRTADYRLTATVLDGRLIALAPGDAFAPCCGIAFDLGTTTLVGYLFDLREGRQRAVVSALNPQVAYGDDVISRLGYAMAEPQGQTRLQEVLVEALNALMEEAAALAGVSPEHIYEIVAVGNMAMHHLFLGLDPTGLGLAPYVPTFRQGYRVRAQDLGLHAAPGAEVYLMPNIAGFVGSDTVAVLLATLVHQSRGIKLVIDLGTNGEIVLGAEGRLLACSTAAGPAFEGARIRQGMRAAAGAIDRVKIDRRIRCHVIGEGPAWGICGSGLIEAVAQLLERGLVSPSGRLLAPGEHGPDVGPPLLARVLSEEADGRRIKFRLMTGEEAGTGQPIDLTQEDIRQLQLAKGAIAAGLRVLMREMGIGAEDIAEVLLAGAFGSFVDPWSARRIGLIPALPLERIKAIGNAAGAGAQIALLNRAERRLADLIAARAEHINLFLRPQFEDYFIQAMAFPQEEPQA